MTNDPSILRKVLIVRSPPELRVEVVEREFELDIRDEGEPPNDDSLESDEDGL